MKKTRQTTEIKGQNTSARCKLEMVGHICVDNSRSVQKYANSCTLSVQPAVLHHWHSAKVPSKKKQKKARFPLAAGRNFLSFPLFRFLFKPRLAKTSLASQKWYSVPFILFFIISFSHVKLKFIYGFEDVEMLDHRAAQRAALLSNERRWTVGRHCIPACVGYLLRCWQDGPRVWIYLLLRWIFLCLKSCATWPLASNGDANVDIFGHSKGCIPRLAPFKKWR